MWQWRYSWGLRHTLYFRSFNLYTPVTCATTGLKRAFTALRIGILKVQGEEVGKSNR